MEVRLYDPARDRDAVLRIFREIGWVEPGKEPAADAPLTAGRTLVADVDGAAECAVSSAQGDIAYLDERLPFAGLTGVSTSRVARKQGLARRLAARSVALDAADGVLVHGLGMFEQGFYNALGYGTGTYEHWVRFDPAHLLLDVTPRIACRLGPPDAEAMHAARLQRLRVHGSVNLYPVGATQHEVLESDNGFGLGYRDGPGGAISHYLWCQTRDVAHGPYTVSWIVYRDRREFLELLALLKGLSDQVNLVQCEEPGGVQLQDLIAQPIKDERVRRDSRYAAGVTAHAYWQMRICDLPGCLAQTHLPGESVRCNLLLEDPIAGLLEEDAPWRGVGGEYVVTLGQECRAERGRNPALPTLEATVNAFTRLWLGVRPATGLAMTDALRAPQPLLERLDGAVRLPVPHMGWDF